MKIGIMQPYFFPYLGYFTLIKHTDLFVVFDVVQFVRHGWMDRNRILKPNGEAQYFRASIKKHHSKALINAVQVDNSQLWQDKILKQLEHYKKKAPYYKDVLRLLINFFKNKYENISELNTGALHIICDYLGLETRIQNISEFNLVYERPNSPDEWALNICKTIGNVTEYWNAPGGKLFFDPEKYIAANIQLKFVKINFVPYKQGRNVFIPGLSILDVMMFNSKDEIHRMLDDFKLI
jgi:hypothetical protein